MARNFRSGETVATMEPAEVLSLANAAVGVGNAISETNPLDHDRKPLTVAAVCAALGVEVAK